MELALHGWRPVIAWTITFGTGKHIPFVSAGAPGKGYEIERQHPQFGDFAAIVL